MVFNKVKYGQPQNLRFLKKTFLSSKTLEKALKRNDTIKGYNSNLRRRLFHGAAGGQYHYKNFSNPVPKKYSNQRNLYNLPTSKGKASEWSSRVSSEKDSWRSTYKTKHKKEISQKSIRKNPGRGNLKMLVKKNTRYLDDEYINEISKKIDI